MRAITVCVPKDKSVILYTHYSYTAPRFSDIIHIIFLLLGGRNIVWLIQIETMWRMMNQKRPIVYISRRSKSSCWPPPRRALHAVLLPTLVTKGRNISSLYPYMFAFQPLPALHGCPTSIRLGCSVLPYRIHLFTRTCPNWRAPFFFNRMKALRTWSILCILWHVSSAKCGIKQKIPGSTTATCLYCIDG